MIEPEFDADGYPTEETLNALEESDGTDFEAIAQFLVNAWYYPNYIKLYTAKAHPVLQSGKRRRLRMSTGGWSGNEDLIYHLPQMFTTLYFREEHRGGHYLFEKTITEQEHE